MPVEPLEVRRPPVILLGMHRSGTSLIARLLDELGLFQGADLQEDHESTWFLETNDQLMRRSGATWDNPGFIRTLLSDPAALDLTATCIRKDVRSKRIAGFLGLKRYLRHGGLEKIESPWGWKDPRTVFTLPLWLALFPTARIVYIVRNGVDVASSLRVREVRELARRVEELPKKAKQYNRHSMLERAAFKGSSRCLTLAGGFSLWEEYVAEADAALARIPNERLVINYERLLADPRDSQNGLETLARFCQLDAPDKAIATAVGQIKPSRASAFLKDPELAAFYEQVRKTPWMVKHGYAEMA